MVNEVYERKFDLLYFCVQNTFFFSTLNIAVFLPHKDSKQKLKMTFQALPLPPPWSGRDGSLLSTLSKFPILPTGVPFWFLSLIVLWLILKLCYWNMS